MNPNEVFFIRADIKVNSENTELECFGASLNFQNETEFQINCKETKTPPSTLTKDNRYTCWFSLSPKMVKTFENWCNVTVYWKLKEISDSIHDQEKLLCSKDDFFSFHHPVPPLDVILPNFKIEYDFPNFATMNTPFYLNISIFNNSEKSEEISSYLKSKANSNDVFVVQGSIGDKFRVLPSSKKVITFLLFPLKPGNFYLPSFVFKFVNSKTNQKVSEIPRHQIFIHP